MVKSLFGSIWFSVGVQAGRLDFSVSVRSCSPGRRRRCPSGTEAAELESVQTHEQQSVTKHETVNVRVAERND